MPPVYIECELSFNPTRDTLTLVESTPVDAPVYVAVAQARQPHRHCTRIEYSLSGAAANYFDVNTHNAIVKLARTLNMTLMRDEHVLDKDNQLTLTLAASINATGEQTEMQLHIRLVAAGSSAATNTVHFDRRRYNFTLTEKQPSGTVLGRVRVVGDTAGNARLNVLFNDDQFTFNQTTLITTAQIDGDVLSTKDLQLVIQVTDGVNTDYASVCVRQLGY
jgi:hypothetical protein